MPSNPLLAQRDVTNSVVHGFILVPFLLGSIASGASPQPILSDLEKLVEHVLGGIGAENSLPRAVRAIDLSLMRPRPTCGLYFSRLGNGVRTGDALRDQIHRELMYRPLQFLKRSPNFIGANNETLSVTMRVNCPNCAPIIVQR